MVNNFQKLRDLLLRKKPERSNVLIWLQGDRYDRGIKILELYKLKFAKKIVISGNNVLVGPDIRPNENNINLEDMKTYLLKNKVKPNHIIINRTALNTKDQAAHVIRLAKKAKWNRLLVVSSDYHLPRTYLTFIRVAKQLNYQGKFVFQGTGDRNAKFIPGRKLDIPTLMKLEQKKIKAYQDKGDISSYKEAFHILNNKITVKDVKFRRATVHDAGTLRKWRNDPQTRLFSRDSKKISLKEHMKWLKDSLKNPNRKIYIVEFKKNMVGTIRTDRIENITELSWTVAPEMRGLGYGKAMLKHFVRRIRGDMKAEIKNGNKVSQHIAKDIGMKKIGEERGILHFIRRKVNVKKSMNL